MQFTSVQVTKCLDVFNLWTQNVASAFLSLIFSELHNGVYIFQHFVDMTFKLCKDQSDFGPFIINLSADVP